MTQTIAAKNPLPDRNDSHALNRGIGRNRSYSSVSQAGLACMVSSLMLIATVLPAQEEELPSARTNIFDGPLIELIDYPPADALTPRGIEMLKQERKLFAAELWLLPDYHANDFATTSHVRDMVPEMSKDEVRKIIDHLEDGALNTPQDNNMRFRRALGERIPDFQKALDFFESAQYMRAVDALDAFTKEKILQVKIGYSFDTMPPYCYATVRLFQAEVLGLAGATLHCLVSYQIAYNKLRDSVSFAPTARIRAADIYERSERAHFSIAIYQALLEQHALTLVDTELLRLRIRCMRWMCNDPYRSGSRLVSSITRRLEVPQLDKLTQSDQAKLIDLMYGMMIEAERDENVFGENSMRLAGEPIEGGTLQKGAATAQFLLTNDVAVVGTDDWGALRPREKQELIQMFSETYSERYRTMLEEYYRGLSIKETETDGATE